MLKNKCLFLISFCLISLILVSGCKKCKDGYLPCAWCEDNHLEIIFKDSSQNCKVETASDLKLFFYNSETLELRQRAAQGPDYCGDVTCTYCFDYDQTDWIIFESLSEGFSDTIEILEYRLKPAWFYEKNCCKCDKEIEYMRFRINQDVYEGREFELVH